MEEVRERGRERDKEKDIILSVARRNNQSTIMKHDILVIIPRYLIISQ